MKYAWWLALAMAAVVSWCAQARGAVAYEQPPNPAGGLAKSAWYDPDGLDGDEYAYERWTVAANTGITEIRWRGGYAYSGTTNQVRSFTISILASAVSDTQPNVVSPPLARYRVNGTAGETYAGVFGGVAMYDYHYTLPAAFQATAGTYYWVQIEAAQGVMPGTYWPPDWSWAFGTGGNGFHFRKITGGGFQNITGDLAFAMMSSDTATVQISASAAPVGAGTVTGAGMYAPGATVSLNASAASGWAFTAWTENGTVVRTQPGYTFTASVNRTLVAQFSPAHTVTVGAQPGFAGSVAGGGVFAEGSQATVTATPGTGFAFAGWYNWGSLESMSPQYTFTVTADASLIAYFEPLPLTGVFDFDAGPEYTSLPLSFMSNGLTALLSGTGSGYSVQRVGAVGIAPAGFSGLMLFPNSGFQADLVIDYDQLVSYTSIMYATQELACDSTAVVRITGWRQGVQVGTSTASAPPGTYPTGTLVLSVPAGFDHVVVHWESHPPTCTDWGRILFADNLVAMRLCTPVAWSVPPTDGVACTGGAGDLVVYPSGSEPYGFEWQREAAPGVFVPIADGPTGFGGEYVGATTQVLSVIAAAAGDTGTFRCVVANSCGQATSAPATLTVLPPGDPLCAPPCDPDVNQDGNVDQGDVDYLINVVAGGDNPTGIDADFNRDGNVDQGDIDAIVDVIAGGLCP